MKPKSGAWGIAGSALLLLVMGILTGGLYFYAFCALGLAILALDYLYCAWLTADLQRNLRVQRSCRPAELLLGSKVAVTYHLNYSGRRGRRLEYEQPTDRNLRVSVPSAPFDLDPGAHDLTLTLTPLLRGRYVIQNLRMTTGSLLFCNTVIAGGDDEIRVYTMLGRALTRASDRSVRRYSLGAETIQPGSGPDFARIRDFVPGDSTKHIDWARSSRSGTLVVKDFEDVRSMPLFLLLDVDPSMETGDPRSELEAAVELATMLAVSATLDNERAGLACFSNSNLVAYVPLSGGQEHVARLRQTLASVKTVKSEKVPRPEAADVRQAAVARRAFNKSEGHEALDAVIEETVREHTFNIREDGFVRAISRAAKSAGTPCNIVVITNRSMGMDSLANGIRVARYYGHNVSVALTPHVWYEPGEDADAEDVYRQYRESRETVARLQSLRVRVIELSAAESPSEALTVGKVRNVMRRMK
jgi:uncharacterized protein (DUF58 family)